MGRLWRDKKTTKEELLLLRSLRSFVAIEFFRFSSVGLREHAGPDDTPKSLIFTLFPDISDSFFCTCAGGFGRTQSHQFKEGFDAKILGVGEDASQR